MALPVINQALGNKLGNQVKPMTQNINIFQFIKMIIHNMLDVYNQESKNNVLQFPGQEIKIVIFGVFVVFLFLFVLYVEIGNYL